MLASSDATQEEVNRAIQSLNANLPPDAWTFQWQSAVIDKRSFVTVIPYNTHYVVVHTHAGFEGTYQAFRVNTHDTGGSPISLPSIDYFKIDPGGLVARSMENNCISCHRGGSMAVLPQRDQFILSEGRHTRAYYPRRRNLQS